MLSVLIVGLLAVACPLVAFLAWVRLSPNTVCPSCGSATDPISPEGTERLVGRWVWRRWCSSCRWEGMGRRGPDLTRGPVSHRSGFRWGEDRMEPDMGFRWADDRPDAGRRRPRRRKGADKGFRWGSGGEGGEGGGGGGSGDDAGPAGFVWGDPPDDPPTFRWGG